MNSGRSASLLIELIDKPGQLKEISSIIADCGGNVTGVHYEKGNTESINGCFLRNRNGDARQQPCENDQKRPA